MPKQWFPFLYWVCKQDHWPSTHLTCMVHHRNTSFLVHHCQAILHQLFHSFSGFGILKTQAKFFRVPTSWVLFLCFVFFLLVVMPTDFRQCLQILCGFQKVHTFPAGLGLSAFQELPPVCFFFATNALRLLPFRSLIVLSIFCSTGFSRRFPRVPSLPIRVSAVCYESQSICFFFQFCPFVQVPLDFEQAASFLVCWHFCCLICLLSISTIVWVSIAIFYFPHRLATVFVCLSVLVVFVGRLGKFAVQIPCRPQTCFLGSKLSRFFAKCWRGLQSVGKSSWSAQCGGCRCLHVCSMLRLPWLADKKEIVFSKFCACFVQKKAMKCIPKRVKKWDQKRDRN